MNTLKRLYVGTDSVLDAMTTIVDRLNSDGEWKRLSEGNEAGDTEEPLQPWVKRVMRPSDQERHTSLVDDWGALIVFQPVCYLRIVLSLDLFMRNGKFPRETELPLILRLRHPATPKGSSKNTRKPTNDDSSLSPLSFDDAIRGQRLSRREQHGRYVPHQWETLNIAGVFVLH
jgi:hypothetical protein